MNNCMTKKQKAVLEPFATLLAEMDKKLQEMTTKELTELVNACDAVTTGNCWCFTFQAANIIRLMLLMPR